MIGATFGAGQVAYSLLWLALFFIEIWLMISVFTDLFESTDLSGLAKAGWVVLVIVFPLIGILLYLVLRGHKMRVHEERARIASEVATHRFSKADELTRLAELRDRGDISTEDYEHLRDEVVGRSMI
jgi:uncharacterized membrane protein